MIWTIDTWILMAANDLENDCHIISQAFLKCILERERVAVNGEIISAYQAALQKNSFSRIWFAKISRTLKWCDSPVKNEKSLKNRIKKRLPASVKRFDPDDVKFIVLCYRTQDRHLISGDIGEGDFSKPMTEWLHDEFEICFHELDEDYPYNRSRHRCLKPNTKINTK